MADQANTTPGAVSRRSLFSAAAALPVAVATAAASTQEPAPTPAPLRELADLLACYRVVGMRLLAIDAEHAAALQAVPECLRPGTGTGPEAARWAKWTRGELDALGFPATMTLRPSLADVHLFNRENRPVEPKHRAEHETRCRARVDAWVAKRREQKTWVRSTGLDIIRRRQTALLAERHAIERELMSLLQGVPAAALRPGIDQAMAGSV
jgi:hypothetical protein